MARQGSAGAGGNPTRNYTVALDNFPELWTEILRHVPETDRVQHVPLVSRRFCEACRDPSLWTELRLRYSCFRTEAAWRSFLRWLAAHASGLQKLVFCDDWGAAFYGANPWQLAAWETRAPELIALLAASAPQLRSLEHLYPTGIAKGITPSAIPAQIGQLSQLTHLRLGFGSRNVKHAQVDAVVQRLPSLHTLILEAHYPVSKTVFTFPLSVTACCSHLRHLEIRGAKMGAVPSELGRLTGLTRLQLRDSSVRSLPDIFAQLQALRELDVSENSVFQESLLLPPGLTACEQLTRLEIDSNTATTALPQLRYLQRLGIRASYFAERQPPVAMQRLQFSPVSELWCDSNFAWQLNPMLAELGLLTGLRKLVLPKAELTDLPAGPYLSRLESLSMQNCNFRAGVPASLAAATQLRDLDFRGYSKHGVKLTAADVDVLASLPALESLGVTKLPRKVQRMWDRALEALEAQRSAAGRAPLKLCQVPVYPSH